MLENEPDTNATNPPSEPTPPVRRRRAASRPAGPPTAAATTPPPAETVAPPTAAAAAPPVPTIDFSAAEPTTPIAAGPPTEPAAEAATDLPTADAPPAKRPARKAAAKRTTKKTAGAESVAPDDGTAPVDAPPARAPRKRAAKKSAAVPDTEQTLPLVESTTPESDAVAAESATPVAPEPTETDRLDPIEAALAELAEQHAAEVQPDADADEDADPDVAAEVAAVDPSAIEADAEAEPTADDAEDSAAEDTSDDTADSDDADDSGDGDGRRRRRRRGGRRRRRTGGDDEAGEAESDAPAAADPSTPEAKGEAETETPASPDEDPAEDDGEGDGSRRRRRRRRRRGEDAGTAADDPGEVVVRVREPRRQAKPNNEVTGIEGSTRMEAKRQRRRDGREAGRRRAPILSEAEFLTRRESVARKMIIRQRDDLAQIAVLEDDILVEHYVDRDSATSLIGNVYLGRVQNVLPSMEAAFIDIGRGRNAVIYAGEIDWDSFGAEGQNRKVERVLKSGQAILVQVTKDPIGAKGARLTNHVSIPGRYIVYAPAGHLSGISRKLPDNERKRLKDILSDLVGESASVIVRTAAEGASEDELVRDVNRLKAQWEDIEKKVLAGHAPQQLYGEPDLTVRIVRDLFTEDFAELIIAGNGGTIDAYEAVESYVSHVAPHLADRLRRWDADADGDVFAAYRLDEQIAKGLERKVFLPSGGSLVIDRTEAMTVIDVNTGKFTGAGGNLEATVTSNNLEAAEEIVRQLRLRDIGGIIVIDFIDMVLPSNRELLLRRLVECLGRDRTRHQVAEITSLGLVQMTRKKIGTGLLEAFTSECPHCHGRGVELHDMPVDSQKQADGGAREPRSGGRRPGNGPRPQPPTTPHVHPEAPAAAESSSPVTEEDEKPTRNRRGGRNRRGSGNGERNEPAAAVEPQPETETEADSVPEPEAHFVPEPESHFVPESESHFVPQNESHFVLDTQTPAVPENDSPPVRENESSSEPAEDEAAAPADDQPPTLAADPEPAPAEDPQGEPVPVS